MLVGLDLLGGAMYASNVIAGFKGQAVGVFDNTFGDPVPLIKSLLQHHPDLLVRVHLHWADNHTVSESQFLEIAKRGDKWVALHRQFPMSRLQLSGMCEHQLNQADATKLKAAVLARAPGYEYVNSPMLTSGYLRDGTINEIHGYQVTKPGGRYQISLDGFTALNNGTEAYFTDVETEHWIQKYSDAEIIFGWVPRFNLRQKGTTAPPTQRTAKPDVGYLKTVARLLYQKGSPPTFPFPVKPLPNGWIYKIDSEDRVGSDGRATKPMLISTYKGDWTIKASNGQKLGILKYYGPFTDPKYYRAYSGKWASGSGLNLHGAEIAEKAKSVSGSEFVALVDGKGNAYVIHPSFRTPVRT